MWAEEGIVDECAEEFSETSQMLAIAEDICGPYVWKTYDLLVMPPSFPFGGMENPCLTFVTPTLLAGDKSLATVVAHEISHSWTGNLVTNANYEHFWLNEGFTMFLEGKIAGRMFGNEARDFHGLQGLSELQDCVCIVKLIEWIYLFYWNKVFYIMLICFFIASGTTQRYSWANEISC